MLFFHSNIRAFTRIFTYTLSEKLPRENIRSWKVSKKSSKIPEFLFFFWFLKYRPFPCQLELSLWWNSNGMHFCILGRFILVSLSFRNLGGAKIIFFLFFYVNTYELTQTLHPFANIKYTLNLFLWNSLKSHEHLNKWLLEAIWHFIFQFNTLYIHLQNTYLNQTGQDVSLPWEAPILKVNWSFDYVTKVRSRGKL